VLALSQLEQKIHNVTAHSHTPTLLQQGGPTLARKNKLVHARHPLRRLERIVAGVNAAGRVGELDGSIHLEEHTKGTGRGGEGKRGEEGGEEIRGECGGEEIGQQGQKAQRGGKL
jgi:hypothetical protein